MVFLLFCFLGGSRQRDIHFHNRAARRSVGKGHGKIRAKQQGTAPLHVGQAIVAGGHLFAGVQFFHHFFGKSIAVIPHGNVHQLFPFHRQAFCGNLHRQRAVRAGGVLHTVFRQGQQRHGGQLHFLQIQADGNAAE